MSFQFTTEKITPKSIRKENSYLSLTLHSLLTLRILHNFNVQPKAWQEYSL